MERRRVATGCLLAYVVLSGVDVVAEFADVELLVRLLPVLLMPLLAGYVWWARPPDRVTRLLLVALAFSWLGDCLGDPLLIKIAFFFGTQVTYCLAFWPGRRAGLLARPGPAAAYAVGMGVLIAVVSLQAGGLGPAVAAYGLSLSLMLALATGMSRLATLGAVTFLVSDLVLAYGAFVAPPPDPVNGGVVMATYLAAQLMLVLGTRASIGSSHADPKARPLRRLRDRPRGHAGVDERRPRLSG